MPTHYLQELRIHYIPTCLISRITLLGRSQRKVSDLRTMDIHTILWITALLTALAAPSSALDVCAAGSWLLESGQLSSPQHPSPAPPGPRRCRCHLSLDRDSLQQLRRAEPGDWRLRLTQASAILGCRQRLSVRAEEVTMLQIPALAGTSHCSSHVQSVPRELAQLTPEQSVEVVYESWTKVAGGKFALHFGTSNAASSVSDLATLRVTCTGNELSVSSPVTKAPPSSQTYVISSMGATSDDADKAVQQLEDEQDDGGAARLAMLIGVLGGACMALILIVIAAFLCRRRLQRSRPTATQDKPLDCEHQSDSLLASGESQYISRVWRATSVERESESQERDSAYRSQHSSRSSLTDLTTEQPNGHTDTYGGPRHADSSGYSGHMDIEQASPSSKTANSLTGQMNDISPKSHGDDNARSSGSSELRVANLRDERTVCMLGADARTSVVDEPVCAEWAKVSCV